MSREITQFEWRAAAMQDAGRTWDTFPDTDLISCDAALSHLDEPGFVYYLPAFLLLALKHIDVEWDHPAWMVAGGAVFAVTDRSGYSLSRFARFTPAQVAATRAFLEFVANSGTDHARDAQLALDRYWNTDREGKFLIEP